MKNSRRKFLGGLGLLGAAAIDAGAAGEAAAATRSAATGAHWDREVDMICVGGGAAGYIAARHAIKGLAHPHTKQAAT
jgi:hypothetical protein